MTTTDVLLGLAVLVLTAFVPFSAWTSHRIWKERRNESDRRTLEAMGLDVAEFESELGRRFRPLSYALPIAFASLLALFGSVYLFFGRQLVNLEAPDLLLSIAGQGDEVSDSLVALVYAFASAYVWSCRNIVRRLVAGDLNPAAYYGVGLRLVFAPLVSLVLRYTALDELEGLIPAAAFLTGIFPEEALNWIKSKVGFIFKDRETRLPLENLQGMSAYHRARLSENGIDDAQNLAERDLAALIIETPYDARELLDWILQAKLYAYLRNDLEAVRGQGVRSALNLVQIPSDEALDGLASASGVSKAKLELVAAELAADPAIGLLQTYGKRLAGMSA